MSSLEALSDRIASARDLQSIVRVMKSLSAVSIRQYQDAAQRLRAAQRIVDLGFHALLASGSFRWRQAGQPAGGQGLVVMGSDRGLCGRFNEAVVDRAAALMRAAPMAGPRIPILAVGARAAARLGAAGLEPDTIFFQPGSAAGLTGTAESILVAVEDWQTALGIERVTVVFNAATPTGGTDQRAEVLVPVDPATLDALARGPWPTRQLPMTQGDPDAVFSALMRERLFIALMRAGAESLAAEHATRLRAMQAAEKNITEKLDDLDATFRRTRQEEITTELMDIVAAYAIVGEGAGGA
ncbi:MAG: F0F1 ATP synthase subunit gamma [Thermohalobaculum sp.]|nr:F0F1 ATP synthase subunit gamma [Thermohalobaculum sp.]